MYKEYPNLPLIEEKFLNILKTYKLVDSKNRMVKPQGAYPDFEAQVFLQNFPNTACLFSQRGMVSGQSFMYAYITVIEEKNKKIYAVFCGNRIAFIKQYPNDAFFEDIKNHNVKTLGEIEETDCYGTINEVEIK